VIANYAEKKVSKEVEM
jgi:hypothetical protein